MSINIGVNIELLREERVKNQFISLPQNYLYFLTSCAAEEFLVIFSFSKLQKPHNHMLKWNICKVK